MGTAKILLKHDILRKRRWIWRVTETPTDAEEKIDAINSYTKERR